MVEHFAIGIDPDSFRETVNTAGVQSQISLSERSFAGRKIILGVDRLDYIKGMPQRLAAFDKLLDDFPEWVGKVVLIQVAVPSRTDVLEYAKLRDAVERQVGRINGKHCKPKYPSWYTSILTLWRQHELTILRSTICISRFRSRNFAPCMPWRMSVLSPQYRTA